LKVQAVDSDLSSSSIAKDVEELSRLHNEGILTDEEFSSILKKIT